LHSQEQSDSINHLQALVKTYEYALDLRESNFSKLQQLSLKLAKKWPGPHLMELQELLIKK
jgi:hypothetical protein